MLPAKRLARPVLRVLDSATAAAGTARPGQDTRQWISMGIVHHQDPKQVVTFDEEMGCPLVCVTLQPSGHAVHCRVSMQVAGNGEGEWHPFVDGDEVVVAVPEGNERAGCVILGRLNNSYDRFPMDSVAGQDPTTNVFAFKRRRTPYVEEYAGPILFRSAPTGAFLSIDNSGTVTIRDGDKNALQVSADMFGFQSGDGKAMLQMSLTGKQFIMQMGDAYFQLSASTASNEVNTLLAPGPFALGTSGNAPSEHVTTAEAVVALFNSFLTLYGTPLGIAPGTTDTALASIVTGAIAGLASAPQTVLAMVAAFANPVQKLPALPGAVQLLPGLGCSGFLVG